jgi:twinkle protein
MSHTNDLTNDILQFLKRHEMWYHIVERETSSGRHKEAVCNCPFCEDTELKFSINIKTGMWNCFHLNRCGRKGSFDKLALLLGDKKEYGKFSKQVIGVKNMSEYRKEPVNQKTIKELSEETYAFFESRCIPRDIVKKCGDAVQESVVGGKKYVCFVHKQDEDGRNSISYIQARSITNPKPGQHKKDIRSLTTNPMQTLWLKDIVDKNKKYLYITEGQLDALAMLTYGFENVVSIPQGVESTAWIEYDWDFVNSFKDVYLLFDNDPIGNAKAVEVGRRLATKVHIVKLPLKDMNDCLIYFKVKKDKDGKNIDQLSARSLKNLVHKSGLVPVKEITKPSDYREELFQFANNPNQIKGRSTGFKTVDRLINGLREGELTLFSGYAGSGKSTFLNQLVLNLISDQENPEKVCIASFELSPRGLLFWMSQQALQQSLSVNDSSESLKTKIDIAMKIIDENLYFIKQQDEIGIDHLLRLIELSYRRDQARFFIVDSLMCIENNEKDEHRGQTVIIRKLKTLAKKLDIHIILVAHPRKTDGFSILRMQDICGSSNITNLADNLLIMHKVSEEYRKYEMEKNANKEKKSLPTTKIPNASCFLYCDKFRFDGDMNYRAYFNYNKPTSSFFPCDIDGELLSA